MNRNRLVVALEMSVVAQHCDTDRHLTRDCRSTTGIVA